MVNGIKYLTRVLIWPIIFSKGKSYKDLILYSFLGFRNATLDRFKRRRTFNVYTEGQKPGRISDMDIVPGFLNVYEEW